MEEREIELLGNDNLESTVYTLLAAKARGERVYCNFNGHILHSDTVTMDSAYTEVMGYTKKEYNQKRKEWEENYDNEQQHAQEEAKAKIPDWIKQGENLIFPEKHQRWEKVVNARAKDLYHGSDLDDTLEILEAIENGASMEEAKKMLENQYHSGMSELMVRRLVLDFSSKGPEFWEATSKEMIPPKDKEILEAKKRENIRLAKQYNKISDTAKSK